MPEEAPRPGRPRLSGFEWACIAVIALAGLFRIDLAFHPDIIWDSAWYLLLGRSFADTGTFLMPWTDPPQFNGYWPPLFPLFLAPLIKVFGPSYELLVLAASLATGFLTLAVFLCTKDLYGRTRGFAAAALVAANPAFLVSDARGMSESILALAITLTVWAFLKSLKQPRWIVGAGAFGVFAYLGKPNLGAPFIAAGLVAIGAWRVATRGWRRVLASRIDIVAGAVALLAIFGIVLARAGLLGGKLGGVGLSVIEPVTRAWLHPAMIQVLGIEMPFYVAVFPFKVFFAIAFLAAVVLPFSLYAPQAARAWRDEQVGALWLAVLIPLLAGAVFTTTFYMTETRPLVDFDNIRYLTPAIVPAIWLTIPFWDMERDPASAREGASYRRGHNAWFFLAAGAYVTLLLFSPIAGDPSLSRLRLFVLLALGPLLLALIASRVRYGTITKRSPGGRMETRYVEEKAEPVGRHARMAALGFAGVAIVAFLVFSWSGVAKVDVTPDLTWLFLGFVAAVTIAILIRPRSWLAIILVGLVAGLLAYGVTSWYISVAMGLVIALCAVSRRATVVTMALVLLAATTPTFNTPYPVESWARDVDEMVPPGTVIGVDGPIVYAASVYPHDIKLREMAYPPTPDFDVALVSNERAGAPLDGFTLVGQWNYTFGLTPTLAARIWIESHLFSHETDLVPSPALALWVRTNSSVMGRVHAQPGVPGGG